MIVSREVLELAGMDRDTFVAAMERMTEGTVIRLVGISIAELSLDRVVMTLPVGPRLHQPAGILHGGVSVLLAETAASIASQINVDGSKHGTVGLEINANHLRPVTDGTLTAVATPLHKGRRTMVWDVKLTDEQGKLTCVSRCTVAVIEK